MIAEDRTTRGKATSGWPYKAGAGWNDEPAPEIVLPDTGV